MEDVTLYEIYECMPEEYESVNSVLLSTEIELELAIAQVNPNMKRLYDWCVSTNKVIIIISDMYLPFETVDAILSKCGYKGYKNVYLSSNERKKKSTGELFKKVLCDNNIQGNKIIHIGDSWKSDYFQAKKMALWQ